MISKILLKIDSCVVVFSDDDISNIVNVFISEPRFIITDSIVENDFVKFMLMDYIFAVPSKFPYMASEISKKVLNNKNIIFFELTEPKIPDFLMNERET